MLTTSNHDRNSAGLKYIYPVVSRRSGGLSIGINLNPNNACNWRCIYCQVPNLKRGKAEKIDLDRFCLELEGFIESVLNGDFYQNFSIAKEQRGIKDIAISGNGEPTSCDEFIEIIERIATITARLDPIKRILITNGSLIQQAKVQAGLKIWHELNGEIWFKLDSATQEGMQRTNQINLSPENLLKNLAKACDLAPTWLQTCLFMLDKTPPTLDEQEAYLAFLATVLAKGIPIKGIMLYGIERKSQQPEANRLSKLSIDWFESFAKRIEKQGIKVSINI